jgi:hypothetical protein
MVDTDKPLSLSSSIFLWGRPAEAKRQMARRQLARNQ